MGDSAAARMRRKFSFDIPKLKIGALRPDNRVYRDHRDLYASTLDSRPPTPKSVRPPLDRDIDAELRAACTYIINHPKPSHEVWEPSAAKPALDYASIKDNIDLPPVRTRSTRQHRNEPSRHDLHDSIKYSYKPNVHTEELFKNDASGRPVPQTNARSRADQLMAAASSATATSHIRQRSASHIQSQLSILSHHLPSIPVKAESTDRHRASGRSESVGTPDSTPHTDSTDYPWSASTGLTSAAVTPARSKRTSSQAVNPSENGSVPKFDTTNAEWMRVELEKHKKVMEDREREKERVNEALRLAAETTPTQHTTTLRTPAPASQVPTRKPVPSRPETSQANEVVCPPIRRKSRKENKDVSLPVTRGRADSVRAESTTQASDSEPRGRLLARSSSRLGKASRAAGRAASRAANKAGSITNDVIGHYLRTDSNQVSQDPIERPPSRTRKFSSSVKEYFTPGGATGFRSRNTSVDVGRGHVRSPSFESMQSGVAGSERSSKWRGWRLANKQNAPDSRSDSPGQPSPPQQQKPAINLNRELPPLPRLDQWKPEDEAPVEQKPINIPTRSDSLKPKSRPQPLPAAPMTKSAPDGVRGLRGALSRKDRLNGTSSHLASKEDLTIARLGSPTPPRSGKQSVDVKRNNQSILGDHLLPSPPPHSARSHLSSADATEFDLAALSMSISAAEGPTSIYSTGNIDKHFAASRPDLLRDSSSHSATSTAPEKLLRSTSRLADYAQAAKPPLSGLTRPWKHGTSSSTPYGYSRENGDRMGRQRSADDSVRQYDPHYLNAVEIRTQQEKDKRRRWWQGKEKRSPSQANWMDQVVKSGARNGMLIPDDAAGSPVVRY